MLGRALVRAAGIGALRYRDETVGASLDVEVGLADGWIAAAGGSSCRSPAGGEAADQELVCTVSGTHKRERRGEIRSVYLGQDQPGVHEVEVGPRRVLGADVMAQHLHPVDGGAGEPRRVDVGGHDRAGRTDLLGQPPRHRHAACAGLPAPPARAPATGQAEHLPEDQIQQPELDARPLEPLITAGRRPAGSSETQKARLALVVVSPRRGAVRRGPR
jgi:hypothetical protein